MRIKRPLTGAAGGAGRRRSMGLSLVEMMIAMALGLFIIAALGQLYGGASQAYLLNDNLARLNENGRFAVDFLSSDLRMAGYLSCGGASASIANSVQGAGHWLFVTRGIQGFEGGVDTLPVEFRSQVRTGTDALILRHAVVDVERTLLAAETASAVMDLGVGHGFEVGEILVVSNPSCTQTSVFQVTRVRNFEDPAATDPFDAIQHESGTATVNLGPGNCTPKLFGSFDCSSVVRAQTGTFPRGSSVNPFTAAAYYVSNADPPALMRQRLSHNGGQAAAVTEELLRGVENLQILYGVDTTDDAESSVNAYVTANQVTDWGRVVSVRFALLIRSHDARVRRADSRHSFNLAGTTVTSASDRYLRRAFSGLVALRNVIP